MARSFALQMQAFAKQAGSNAAVVVSKTGIDIHARVVRRTPVDTGRARGNWLVDIGAPRNEPVGRVDGGTFGSDPVTDEANKLASFKGGDTIYISNNLPYIEALEDGHSKQSAPGAMVSRTVNEFEAIVRKNLEGLPK